MKFSTLTKNAKAAALVEYGMLVGLIAVLAIVAVNNLGSTVRDTFVTVSDTLSGSLASATASNISGEGEAAAEDAFPIDPNATIAWTFLAISMDNSVSSEQEVGFSNWQGETTDLTQHVGIPGSVQSTFTSFSPTLDAPGGAYFVDFYFQNYANAAFTGQILSCSNGFSATMPTSGTAGGSGILRWEFSTWSGYGADPRRLYALPPLFEVGETYTCQIAP